MNHVASVVVASLLIVVAQVSTSTSAATDLAVQAMQRGDFNTALAQLRPLAAKNDPNAEFLLGMLYDAGKGVAQDPAAAVSWYRKAAKQDHLMAQLYLGVLYYAGQGIKQDYGEALRWLKAPAEHGNEQAQFYLGSMYANGNGVRKDDDEAIRWLTRSATQRNTRAMGMLATELLSRHRDDQDLVDAYTWSHLGAELDPVQAMTTARSVIEQYCSADQKKRGKAAMSEWKRKWSNAAHARLPK